MYIILYLLFDINQSFFGMIRQPLITNEEERSCHDVYMEQKV